jgi:hypothetical protein
MPEHSADRLEIPFPIRSAMLERPGHRTNRLSHLRREWPPYGYSTTDSAHRCFLPLQEYTTVHG